MLPVMLAVVAEKLESIVKVAASILLAASFTFVNMPVRRMILECEEVSRSSKW